MELHWSNSHPSIAKQTERRTQSSWHGWILTPFYSSFLTVARPTNKLQVKDVPLAWNEVLKEALSSAPIFELSQFQFAILDRY